MKKTASKQSFIIMEVLCPSIYWSNEIPRFNLPSIAIGKSEVFNLPTATITSAKSTQVPAITNYNHSDSTQLRPRTLHLQTSTTNRIHSQLKFCRRKNSCSYVSRCGIRGGFPQPGAALFFPPCKYLNSRGVAKFPADLQFFFRVNNSVANTCNDQLRPCSTKGGPPPIDGRPPSLFSRAYGYEFSRAQ
jgi:hypothetical protein